MNKCLLFCEQCARIFAIVLLLEKSYFFNHLRRFGLMMHIGVDTALSKTEAIYFPQPRVGYSNADAPRFDIRNADGPAVGFVDF